MKSKNFKDKSTFKKIKDIPLYELFHRNSEINSLNYHKFTNGISNAIFENEFIDECINDKNLYSDNETIKLPNPNLNLTNMNVFDVIKNRRSIRSFSNQHISQEELSTILFYSGGVTGEYRQTEGKPQMNLYAYPSAGGLRPLHMYVFITNVDNINSGIYYYNPIENSLKVIKYGFTSNDFKEITGSANLAHNASFVIYILGMVYLTGYKYGDRGYRFMLLEAGHLAQNLYLTSTAIGAGAVASGGFLDGEILELLNLGDTDMFVLYEVIVGKPDYSTNYLFYDK